nr:hypothetical protein [Candidatus Sigynarchaeota archaeon]
MIFSPAVVYVALYADTIIKLRNDALEFSFLELPDPETFIPANVTKLAEMAEYYDARFENYHIPLNMSTDTFFNEDNCTSVSWYAFSDNTGQWTGLAITAWVFKYLAAINEGNTTIKQDSLRVIRKLLQGMSMQLAVPNGGLGPNYSGILARGWAGPEQRSLPGVDAYYFQDAGGQHHNGTGPYANYRWRSYTSNDEYSGFYAGLAMILKYVDDPVECQDIQATARLMIDQVAAYMLDTNFLGMDWHGGPTGVHQRALFFQGGAFALLLLKLAATAFPGKYAVIYYHYAAEELYAVTTLETNSQETIANYYAYAFNYHVMFALLQLEDQPGSLRQLYLDNFLRGLWSITWMHRNPFYNVIYLALASEPGINATVEHDVEDNLMRYGINHYPDRQLGHVSPLPPDYVRIDNVQALSDFLQNDPRGGWYLPYFTEVNAGQIYYNKPLTPEYQNGDIFLWEKNPYQYQESVTYTTREFAGFSFSIVYWIARARGFIAPP